MPESLVPQAIKDAIHYERYKASQVKGVLPILNTLREDIRGVILRADLENNKEINTLLIIINSLVDAAFAQIEELSLREYADLIAVVIEKEERSLLPLIGVQKAFTDKSIASVVPVILASYVLGKTYKKHLRDLKGTVKSQVQTQIRTGIADNENVTQLALRIAGTKNRKYRDGTFSSTLRHIDSITRTVIQGYVSSAKLWTWNKRGIKKYRWISVLDSNTTIICMSRSNKVYILGEGPTPPAHYRCRSIIVPYVSGAEIPTSYPEFLRSLPRPEVEDILGKGKAELFLSNKLKLERFTTQAGRELTVKELRARA